MMKYRALLLIIMLAGVLRLWDLGGYPTGFNADEASLGYNAYSILKTGKDEYGIWFPLTFKSFGDYKPGLYVYLDIPFVAILGLNEWSVRLPSALLGILTVYIVYLLGKRIFRDENTALISAFLLSISPWHIHFSRGAWETNVATFFISLGVLLFIKGLESNRWLFLSLVSFIASGYTYQSPRLVVPLLLFILLIFYKNQLLHRWKSLLKFIPIILILVLPMLFQFISGTASARFSGLSIFSDTGVLLRSNELRTEHTNINSFVSISMHNKITAYVFSFLGHYLDHFTPDFLFINGDSLIRNKAPEVGEFYLIESLFLIIGLFLLIKNKTEHAKILIVWTLIAPTASALTYQTPHALRSLNMVIPLILIMGYGVREIIINLRDYLKKLVFVVIICLGGIFLCYETVHYLESYYIHYPKRYSLSWEHGFKEMVQKLNRYESSYDKIIVTDRYDQPYILVLFFKQYDPKKYQPQAVLSERDKFNFGTVRSFDKYEFKQIKNEDFKTAEHTLFIGTKDEIPSNVNIIDKVDFPNGDPAFIFAEK